MVTTEEEVVAVSRGECFPAEFPHCFLPEYLGRKDQSGSGRSKCARGKLDATAPENAGHMTIDLGGFRAYLPGLRN